MDGPKEAGGESVHLDAGERKQASRATPVGPLVIHEVVRDQGLAELGRSFAGLAWSGLSAGLSIAFSFLVEAAIQAGLPDTSWRKLVASFGYSFGFLIVVLGRQQLFTETTLTAVIPALAERTWGMARATLRVWGIVRAANLAGTFCIAAVLAQPGVMPAPMADAMSHIAHEALQSSFGIGMVRAGFAGWLIGLMIWLLPGSGPAGPLIIILLTYAVSVGGFPHGIAGSVEVAYLVFTGQASGVDYVGHFLVPTLIGNCIGGTLLAALLNHTPVADELEEAAEADGT